MHIPNFLYSASLLALGAIGLRAASAPEEVRILAGPPLFFGGAALLCALFALKEPHHGTAGASFLAFLAALTSGRRLHDLLRDPPDAAPGALAGTAALLILSLLFLGVALLHWRRKRRTGPTT